MRNNPVSKYRGVSYQRVAGVTRFADPLTGERVAFGSKRGGLTAAKAYIDARLGVRANSGAALEAEAAKILAAVQEDLKAGNQTGLLAWLRVASHYQWSLGMAAGLLEIKRGEGEDAEPATLDEPAPTQAPVAVGEQVDGAFLVQSYVMPHVIAILRQTTPTIRRVTLSGFQFKENEDGKALLEISHEDRDGHVVVLARIEVRVSQGNRSSYPGVSLTVRGFPKPKDIGGVFMTGGVFDTLDTRAVQANPASIEKAAKAIAANVLASWPTLYANAVEAGALPIEKIEKVKEKPPQTAYQTEQDLLKAAEDAIGTSLQEFFGVPLVWGALKEYQGFLSDFVSYSPKNNLNPLDKKKEQDLLEILQGLEPKGAVGLTAWAAFRLRPSRKATKQTGARVHTPIEKKPGMGFYLNVKGFGYGQDGMFVHDYAGAVARVQEAIDLYGVRAGEPKATQAPAPAAAPALTGPDAAHGADPNADRGDFKGQPLYGHTSMETAYVQEDFPWGFRGRTQRRVWVEYKDKKGYRFMAQTQDPENGRWNKPKASTYALLAEIMYLNPENDHVDAHTLTEYSDAADFGRFIQRFPDMPPFMRQVLQVWAGAKKRMYQTHPVYKSPEEEKAWAEIEAKLSQLRGNGRGSKRKGPRITVEYG